MNSKDLSYIDGRRDLVLADSFDHIRKNIKAVVFDLDGTLTDSIGRIIACTKLTFESYGFEKPSDKAIMSTIGLELCEGLTSLLPEDKKSIGKEFTASYRKMFLEHKEFWIDVLFDGIEPLMKTLKEQGLKIGYASGRSVEGIHRTLDATFLGDYCDGVCGGSEVPSKPDPKMMYLLCERMGLDSKEVLGVGDSALDIRMYKNSGSFSLGVQTGVYSGDALLAEGCDMLLPEISYLEKYFGR